MRRVDPKIKMYHDNGLCAQTIATIGIIVTRVTIVTIDFFYYRFSIYFLYIFYRKSKVNL